MDDKFTIRLRIDGFKHPVTIDKEDEELYRKAALLVEKRFALYKDKYIVSKIGDAALYSVVALELAIKLIQMSDNQDPDIMNSRIKELTGELEDYLKSK